MASTKRASSAWSVLPSDLLGLVLPRLHSLADRARVAAVCRPWRSGVRLHRNLPPPMPWVALGDEAYLDVVNGDAARRLSLHVPENARCRGSDDHSLFLTRATGGCFLADPFSGAVLPVVDLASFIGERAREEMFPPSYSISNRLRVRKVVLLWPPRGSSSEPVVAALMKNSANKYETTIFVCRAGTDTGAGKESYGAMAVELRRIKDVAFFRGNLYALSTRGSLLAVELGEGPRGNPAITGVTYVMHSPDDYIHAHDGIRPTSDVRLVQSGDQLLMLRRWVIDDGTSGDGSTTSIFDVYEADFGASPCRWKAASSLRGRALFLGRRCSKSVPVGDGHYGGAQEDCIYFVRNAGDSGIYNMEHCRVRPLVPDAKVLRRHGRSWKPTWVFPDQSRIEAHYSLKKTLAQGACGMCKYSALEILKIPSI